MILTYVDFTKNQLALNVHIPPTPIYLDSGHTQTMLAITFEITKCNLLMYFVKEKILRHVLKQDLLLTFGDVTESTRFE